MLPNVWVSAVLLDCMLEGPQPARAVVACQSCALSVCRRTEGAVNDMVLTSCSGNLQVCAGFVVGVSYGVVWS